jgi:hypothetical protein
MKVQPEKEGSEMEYRVGQQVRIVIEGKLLQVGGHSGGSYNRMVVGHNTIYRDDPDRPDVKVTCKIVQPEIRHGQVWSADARWWFVQLTSGGTLTMLPSPPPWPGTDLVPYAPFEFFERFPDARLMFNPGAVDVVPSPSNHDS